MSENRPTKSDGKFPPVVWEKIQSAIPAIDYGLITLVFQDGKPIQMEITEKIRCSDLNNKAPRMECPAAVTGSMKPAVIRAGEGLLYGQLILQIKDGKVVQIDRIDRRRLLQGVDGEGI
ncbi:MAG TPA: YezD family protein [Selenomonadales bacterium]|nr:YezD family protein [Selenomonadales bacterium]